MTVGVVVLTGVFEVAMVFAIRPTYPDSPSASRAVQFFGIFTAILISGALFPQYYEIYKRKEVVGVSMLFMLVDLSGGKTLISFLFICLMGLSRCVFRPFVGLQGEIRYHRKYNV